MLFVLRTIAVTLGAIFGWFYFFTLIDLGCLAFAKLKCIVSVCETGTLASYRSMFWHDLRLAFAFLIAAMVVFALKEIIQSFRSRKSAAHPHLHLVKG